MLSVRLNAVRLIGVYPKFFLDVEMIRVIFRAAALANTLPENLKMLLVA